MPTSDETLGQVDISTAAIASIAEHAINQSYGVVGMASKNLVDGLARLLTRDSHRGIDISVEDGEVVVDVYVIIEHGVRIRAVAESIQHSTKFNVEKVLGMPVRAVNVYVQGLRLSEDGGSDSDQ
jgi:uncharacterized alkaline shock family protein YloU